MCDTLYNVFIDVANILAKRKAAVRDNSTYRRFHFSPLGFSQINKM